MKTGKEIPALNEESEHSFKENHMKTSEELNVLKEEVEALNRKLAELTEEELKQICGGNGEYGFVPKKSENTTENAHDSKDYSAGRNPLWDPNP